MADFVDSHQIPPPYPGKVFQSVRPLVRVKPEMLAPLVRYTQRPGPWMKVNWGPFTLRTPKGLSTATRLVVVSGTARPPAAYTPLVTRTSSPPTAASTAS